MYMSADRLLRMAAKSLDVEAVERRDAAPRISRFKQETAMRSVVCVCVQHQPIAVLSYTDTVSH